VKFWGKMQAKTTWNFPPQKESTHGLLRRRRRNERENRERTKKEKKKKIHNKNAPSALERHRSQI